MENERDDYSDLSADELAAREEEEAQHIADLKERAQEGDEMADIELCSIVYNIPMSEILTEAEEDSRCV